MPLLITKFVVLPAEVACLHRKAKSGHGWSERAGAKMSIIAAGRGSQPKSYTISQSQQQPWYIYIHGESERDRDIIYV